MERSCDARIERIKNVLLVRMKPHICQTQLYKKVLSHSRFHLNLNEATLKAEKG